MPTRPPDSHRLLVIYLRDHYAAAAAGVRLARRMAQRESELERLAEEIESDRLVLGRVLARLEIEPSVVKGAVAVAAEYAGRLKPNGALLSRSPLSGVLELETLYAGVSGKLALWRTLADLGPGLGLVEFEFARLEEKAHDQLRRIEDMLHRARRHAFSGDVRMLAVKPTQG